jgi:hypothetical protein
MALKTIFETNDKDATTGKWINQNKVVLNGRSRISVQCDATCNAFEGKKLVAETKTLTGHLDRLWGNLKTMVWTTGVLSFLSIIVVVVFAFMANKNATALTQNNLLIGYGWALCTMFIAMVFCWYICFSIKNDFNTFRATFATWAGCIVNPQAADVASPVTGWRLLMDTLHTESSLDNFHNWMIFWTVFTSLLFVFGLLALLKGLKTFARIGAGYGSVVTTTVLPQARVPVFNGVRPTYIVNNGISPLGYSNNLVPGVVGVNSVYSPTRGVLRRSLGPHGYTAVPGQGSTLGLNNSGLVVV